MPLEAALRYSDGITGNNPITARADSSEVIMFSHTVASPVDTQTGAVRGSRIHGMAAVTKPVDTASPPLKQALCTGQTLEEIAIDFYRITPEGATEVFYTITMTNVKVATIQVSLPNTKEEDSATLPFLETVEFLYEKINWTHADGFEFEDSWAGE